jgi:vacuolar-type H+-ATPase subunit H
VDIISEILETDKIAEDKIAQAKAESEKILKDSRTQELEISDETNESIEQYRQEKCAQLTDELRQENEKLAEAEKAKIDELEKLYEENHTRWEQEIFDSVISD